MPVQIGVLRETAPDERRVAVVPEVATKLLGLGARVKLQTGAGAAAGMPDEQYAGVEFAADADEVLSDIDVLLKVNPPSETELDALRPESTIIGFLQPYRTHELVKKMCQRRLTGFAMELIPRISRAQSMDALSSQAAVAGYKAALIAADNLARFFPMLTTAAGTIRPALVLVIGAGVAGLQAIATAKRLGAVVEGYDVRSATREQVQSLGARFVDTGVSAEAEGGYARELTEEEKTRQQEVLDQHIAAAHAVITTAAVPGRSAPRIISRETVARMTPGAVIVDIAAESGGNCELTKPGETIESGGITIIGPLNLASELSFHASSMYARNLLNFLQPFLGDGKLEFDWEDEVITGALLTHNGEIRHEPTREAVLGTTREHDS